MIIAYINNKTLMAHVIDEKNCHLIKQALWLDIISPNKEEEVRLEKLLNLDIPTREEMQEIELSSRLYKKEGNLFMTATMIAQSTSIKPIQEPVTFVLTQTQLITIRYFEPQAFKLFIAQLNKFNLEHDNALLVLIELLEVIVDRLADILESIGRRLDEISEEIFLQNHRSKQEKIDYQKVMQRIGLTADLNTKARDSLVTFNRLASFFSIETDQSQERARVSAIRKDIDALSDYANFISTKVNFLLDTSLGMISIEQSNIIKIFSVAAVIFLPPTLIASIYGMNFKFMPELSFKWGYLMAVGLMFLSALIPYKFFRYKKWL